MKTPTEYVFTIRTSQGETDPQYRCREWPSGGWRPQRKTYDTQAMRVWCYRSQYVPTHFGWLFALLCRLNLPHLAEKLPGYWQNPVFWTEYKV